MLIDDDDPNDCDAGADNDDSYNDLLDVNDGQRQERQSHNPSITMTEIVVPQIGGQVVVVV